MATATATVTAVAAAVTATVATAVTAAMAATVTATMTAAVTAAMAATVTAAVTATAAPAVAEAAVVAGVAGVGVRRGRRSGACCADRGATGHQDAGSGHHEETPRALCSHGNAFPSIVSRASPERTSEGMAAAARKRRCGAVSGFTAWI
ncbi:hypothetical protein ACWEQC_25540 [Streptomyces shenzhenensis]